MPTRPIIGVPTQTLEEIPGELPRCWVMSQQYVRVLVAAGAVPWIIPLLRDDRDTLRAIYDRLDGVFLPGGVDSIRRRTRRSQPRSADGPIPTATTTELTLARWAMEDHKPVLAVCRGVQVLNVAAGGTLYQDLAAQMPGSHQARLLPAARARTPAISWCTTSGSPPTPGSAACSRPRPSGSTACTTRGSSASPRASVPTRSRPTA